MKRYVWLVLVLLLGCSEKHSENRSEPAPGFCVGTNLLGEWHSRVEGADWNMGKYRGQRNTKQGAIDRTWGQYEWKERLTRHESWYEVECTEER